MCTCERSWHSAAVNSYKDSSMSRNVEKGATTSRLLGLHLFCVLGVRRHEKSLYASRQYLGKCGGKRSVISILPLPAIGRAGDVCLFLRDHGMFRPLSFVLVCCAGLDRNGEKRRDTGGFHHATDHVNACLRQENMV